MNHQVVHQRHAGGVAAAAAATTLVPSPPSGNHHPTPRRPRIKSARLRSGNINICSKIRVVIAIVAGAVVVVGLVVLLVQMVGSSSVRGGVSGNRLAANNHNNNHNSHAHAASASMDEFTKQHYMPLNRLYHAADSMDIVGDRSDRYAKLRQDVDAVLPLDAQRSLQRVQELTTRHYSPIQMNSHAAAAVDAHNSDQVIHNNGGAADEATTTMTAAAAVPYDIYQCPDDPPPNYPYSWNMLSLLQHWPPDDPTPRSQIHQGLCIFDYTKDYQKAMRYRAAELPFVVINDPAVHHVVERWNAPNYLETLLGTEAHRCEYSENNHFMYFVPVNKARRKTKQVPDNWKAPTKLLRIPYREWLAHANVTDDSQLGPDRPHWYYRLIGCGLMGNDGSCDRGASEYLYDELPFFQPKPSLYIVDPHEQKGIHCRFGMKGVIAENHFDGSRNTIVVLGGSRRYILSHPNQCENLHLYKKGHPSARHSAVDWSNPDLEAFPLFGQAKGNEVVLQPGQVLYLPTNWFHFIVSLELNFQCNTRSGISMEYMPPIKQCGF